MFEINYLSKIIEIDGRWSTWPDVERHVREIVILLNGPPLPVKPRSPEMLENAKGRGYCGLLDEELFQIDYRYKTAAQQYHALRKKLLKTNLSPLKRIAIETESETLQRQYLLGESMTTAPEETEVANPGGGAKTKPRIPTFTKDHYLSRYFRNNLVLPTMLTFPTRALAERFLETGAKTDINFLNMMCDNPSCIREKKEIQNRLTTEIYAAALVLEMPGSAFVRARAAREKFLKTSDSSDPLRRLRNKISRAYDKIVKTIDDFEN